jgi:hypothetical protein
MKETIRKEINKIKKTVQGIKEKLNKDLESLKESNRNPGKKVP